MQMNDAGVLVRIQAATVGVQTKHVPVRTEVIAMAVAAANALEETDMQAWADCQAVVSGYGELMTTADGYENITQVCGWLSGRQLRRRVAASRWAR